jgi:uncharacterized membrane protein
MEGLSRLVRGLPGHPTHPPLTDVAIGVYTFATALGVIGALGGIRDVAGKAMFVALVAGLLSTVPTAATGFVDWLSLSWGSPRWRTATWHLTAMLSATTLFAVAAWFQWPGYQRAAVTPGGLIVALLGFVVLTVGGWLGGSVVFVHGMRVLRRPEESGVEAIKPGGEDEALSSHPSSTAR